MCVCPDYVLCVEERLDELLSTIKATYVLLSLLHEYTSSRVSILLHSTHLD